MLCCMASNTATTAKAARLGGELRRLREERSLTLRKVAGALDLDPGWLSKVETGKKIPDANQTARILTHLGINGDLYEKVMGMLTGIDEPQWLALSLPDQQEQHAALVDFEAKAHEITENAPLLIPGLVQVAGYARAIMSAGTMPRSEISTRVATRMGRRDVIDPHRTNDPARFTAYIGEAALRQTIGGPAVMIEQATHLLTVIEWDNADVRVVPFGDDWHPGLEGQFSLIDPRAGEDLSIVYLENRRSGLILHTDEDVTAYRTAANVVRERAMSPADTKELIADVINEMRTR